MSPELVQPETPITDPYKKNCFDFTSTSSFEDIIDLCVNKPLYQQVVWTLEDYEDIKNALESLNEPRSISLEDFKQELKNQKAIEFLDNWLAEPDDLGEEFWNKFRQELEDNPFHIN